jgi:hypothetical protein
MSFIKNSIQGAKSRKFIHFYLVASIVVVTLTSLFTFGLLAINNKSGLNIAKAADPSCNFEVNSRGFTKLDGVDNQNNTFYNQQSVNDNNADSDCSGYWGLNSWNNLGNCDNASYITRSNDGGWYCLPYYEQSCESFYNAGPDEMNLCLPAVRREDYNNNWYYSGPSNQYKLDTSFDASDIVPYRDIECAPGGFRLYIYTRKEGGRDKQTNSGPVICAFYPNNDKAQLRWYPRVYEVYRTMKWR